MTTTDTKPVAVPKEVLPPEDDASAANPTRWAALVVLLVAVFMDMLDGNVVNVAIPVIQRDLGANYASIQWIGAGYVLAFALMLITGGRLGDIYGRKRVFQVGVLGFTVASLSCGLAANPEILVGSRLVQGAMAGIMVPQVLSIIHVSFPRHEQGKVFAVYGMVGGLAATTAPLIGGLLVNMNAFGLQWRPAFLVNVPIGIAGLVLGWRYISESKAPVALRIDLTGVALAMLGLVLLLYPLTMGRELGWPAWAFAAIVAAAVVLTCFVSFERLKQRTDGSPLVALKLFEARSFSAGLSLQLAFYLLTAMFFLSWYLFMQIGLGWTPLRAGSTALAFCVGAFLTAAASVTVLVPKFGRAVLQAGALVMILGFAIFYWIAAVMGGTIGSWHMVVPLFLLGLGFGAVASPIPQFALADVPHQDAGSASGLINTMQQLGLALGIALVALVFLSPLRGFAADKVDAATPQLRQDFAATGVPAGDVDAVVASLRDCTVDRLDSEEPTRQPASCRPQPAIARNPAAAVVLANSTAKVGADTFAGAFLVAIASSAAVMVLVLLLTFGLPKQLRPQSDAGAEAG